MKTIKLNGAPRTVSNKQAIKTLRRNGMVPCVLYGPGVENQLFSVNAKDLLLLTDTPNSYIVDLQIDGKNYKSILHAIQYHPVTDEPLHVDFLSVSNDKPVSINVPIIITGNSEGVRQGGKLAVSARKLRISAMLKDLPDSVTIDISTLGIGKNITAGDLKYENIQIITPKSTIICSVKMTRAALGTTAAPEAK